MNASQVDSRERFLVLFFFFFDDIRTSTGSCKRATESSLAHSVNSTVHMLRCKRPLPPRSNYPLQRAHDFQRRGIVQTRVFAENGMPSANPRARSEDALRCMPKEDKMKKKTLFAAPITEQGSAPLGRCCSQRSIHPLRPVRPAVPCFLRFAGERVQ